MTPLIELKQVSKVYPHRAQDVCALDRINLTISGGELLSIVGPSGSGKSTLMHLIGCLDRPTSGELWIDGSAAHLASDEELSLLRAQTIGFVFQSFHLIPQLSALDNVLLPIQYHSGGTEDQAVETLIRLGLKERMRHLPGELSGGERQRVAIARALSGNPKIILADEPTGNLDSETGETILAIFEALSREGKSVIVVTHDDAVAKRTAVTYHLKDGRL